jgi:hypothetical protein
MADIVKDAPKLVAKSLGNPKDVLKMEAADAVLFLGTIYGVAQRVRVKASLDKAGDPVTHEQIMGEFEGIPAGTIKADIGEQKGVKIDRIRSSVLYLPTGINEKLAAPLKIDGAPPIEFALKLYAVKHGKGFAWKVEPLFAPVASDPLARIRGMITGDTAKVPPEAQKETAKVARAR